MEESAGVSSSEGTVSRKEDSDSVDACARAVREGDAVVGELTDEGGLFLEYKLLIDRGCGLGFIACMVGVLPPRRW